MSSYYIKGDEEPKDDTTLQFDLKVKCIKNKNAPKNATDPDELFINSKGIFSSYNTKLFSFASLFGHTMHCSLPQNSLSIKSCLFFALTSELSNAHARTTIPSLLNLMQYTRH